MPRLSAANNAKTTLSANMISTDNQMAVADSSLFPAPPFRITVDTEVIEVGGVSGNTFTGLVRAQEGTAAAAHSSGAVVENRWTAGMYSELDTYWANCKRTVSNAAPTNPSTGDEWIDTSTNPAGWKIWLGSAWVSATKYQ